MKQFLYIFTMCCFGIGMTARAGYAEGIVEVGGVYEVPKGSVDFANAWGNALGMKMRLATRGNASDNLGLTFCYCRYPATDGGGRYDATMMSVGLSQKSTFNDDARLRPYVKGEAGVMQGLEVWKTTIDPVTGSALHTQMQGGHTDSYLAGHMGLVLDVTAHYQIFAETGFILTLEGERKKVIPFQIGFAFHP